jgi:hypothetical protein
VRKIKQQLDHIDALLDKRRRSSPTLVHEQLLVYAERGIEAPESLNAHEIRQVCFALIAHYSLLKI